MSPLALKEMFALARAEATIDNALKAWAFLQTCELAGSDDPRGMQVFREIRRCSADRPVLEERMHEMLGAAFLWGRRSENLYPHFYTVQGLRSRLDEFGEPKHVVIEHLTDRWMVHRRGTRGEYELYTECRFRFYNGCSGLATILERDT